MALVQTHRTATHEFRIYETAQGFSVNYQPLHPKTGEPWQRSHVVTVGATIEARGYEGRGPRLYGNLAVARVAMGIQKGRLADARR